MYFTNVLVFFLISWCNEVFGVKVKVEQGWLNGQIQTIEGKGDEQKYYSFKGIPYAKPPIGNLRFRAPQPPFKWKGIRNATEHGAICIQVDIETNEIHGAENCLFLNVYTPIHNGTRLLPVMLYIHGGFYSMGSGNDDLYGPSFLVKHGVVIVTINYRLDVFGFLSVNNEKAPGNAGLKDQIAAMQWVKRNIYSFGGDPNQVTIIGNSAGASSISLHMLSPAAKGLFCRAIIMSGVYSNEFSIPFEPEKRAFALGKNLGQITNDTNELLDFLQLMPAEKLLSVRPDILISDKASASLLITVYFTPVVEKKFGKGQFLTASPAFLMRKRRVNRANILIGYVVQEGLRDATLATEDFLKYYPNYKEFLVPRGISYYQSPKKVLQLGDEIEKFYFGGQSINIKTIKNLVKYTTDSYYVYDINEYLERFPKIFCVKQYFYEFGIYSTRNVYSKPGAMKFGITQATHMDDLGYLFSGRGYNVSLEATEKAYKYIELMTKMWTNFVKYGTPTPDASLGLIWPQYGPSRKYVIIGRKGSLSISTVSYKANTSMGFWHRLYKRFGVNG